MDGAESRPPSPGGPFDAYYYAHCCGKPYVRNDEWLAFFGGIADRIVADIAPRRVLDAGCAMGFLVETLRDRNVEAWGVDVSEYAIAQVDDRVKPFCRVGSIAGGLGGDYDLIVSIEVAEHMPPREAEQAIANICAHTTDVIFTSSPNDYREPTHVNVHPPEYWAGMFARHGFFRDTDYDATYIVPWAARFRKLGEPVPRVIVGYERRYWELLRETHDARAFATDTQSTLASVEADRDAARAELERVTIRYGQTLAELEAVKAGWDELVRARMAAETDLAQARDTIAHMEQSVFWRLRLAWLRLTGRR